MLDSERKQAATDTQELGLGEIKRVIAILEQEDADYLKPTPWDRVAYFFYWFFAWALAILLLYLIEALSFPQGGAATVIVAGAFGLMALIVLLIIVLALAAFAHRYRRCLRQIRELGIDNIYKTIGRISDRNRTTRIILMTPAIPILWIFILVLNTRSEGMALTYVIVLGPIMMGLYFLGRANQRLTMLTDIKSWKDRLLSLKTSSEYGPV